MKFPCKNCGVDLKNPSVNRMSDNEFFWQDCPNCGKIKRYSWLRIEQIVEET
jgi:RNase P subunit RPR2